MVIVVGLALAACTKQTGPSEFNPDGATADVAAAQDAFASAPASSFVAVGADIATVLRGTPAVASASALMLARSPAGGARYARELVRLLPQGGGGIEASAAAIPSAVLGTTFVWDDSAAIYVASDLAGAPATGVRFLLYALDPLTQRPAGPLVEVGYVDLLDKSTATALAFQVKVVGGNVAYLDYAVSSTSNVTGALITIAGYTWNGQIRADFDLKNTVSQSPSGTVLSLDYDLGVPSRGLSIHWTATFANISSTDVAVTVDLGMSGPNGNVRVVGTYGAAGGTFTVKVNGELFATVTLDGSGFVITGAGGQPLTAAEEETLQRIMNYYDESLTAFAGLLTPLG